MPATTLAKPTRFVAATAALATAAATLIAAPAADAAARRGANHLHVTKKHTVVSASTIRPGLARLRNDGSREVALFRKKHEGVTQLVTYMNAKSDRTSKKAFTRFGFIEILDAHADDYVRLTKGTYFLVDISAGKAKASGVRTVAVRGKRADAVRPASARTLRVRGRGAITGATTGGVKPYLRILNRTKSPILVEALRIKPAATDAQVRDFLAHPSDDKLFTLLAEDESAFGLVGFVGAGRDVTMSTTLRKGRYFLGLPSAFGTSSLSKNLRLLTLG